MFLLALLKRPLLIVLICIIQSITNGCAVPAIVSSSKSPLNDRASAVSHQHQGRLESSATCIGKTMIHTVPVSLSTPSYGTDKAVVKGDKDQVEELPSPFAPAKPLLDVRPAVIFCRRTVAAFAVKVQRQPHAPHANQARHRSHANIFRRGRKDACIDWRCERPESVRPRMALGDMRQDE